MLSRLGWFSLMRLFLALCAAPSSPPSSRPLPDAWLDAISHRSSDALRWTRASTCTTPYEAASIRAHCFLSSVSHALGSTGAQPMSSKVAMVAPIGPLACSHRFELIAICRNVFGHCSSILVLSGPAAFTQMSAQAWICSTFVVTKGSFVMPKNQAIMLVVQPKVCPKLVAFL